MASPAHAAVPHDRPIDAALDSEAGGWIETSSASAAATREIAPYLRPWWACCAPTAGRRRPSAKVEADATVYPLLWRFIPRQRRGRLLALLQTQRQPARRRAGGADGKANRLITEATDRIPRHTSTAFSSAASPASWTLCSTTGQEETAQGVRRALFLPDRGGIGAARAKH